MQRRVALAGLGLVGCGGGKELAPIPATPAPTRIVDRRSSTPVVSTPGANLVNERGTILSSGKYVTFDGGAILHRTPEVWIRASQNTLATLARDGSVGINGEIRKPVLISVVTLKGNESKAQLEATERDTMTSMEELGVTESYARSYRLDPKEVTWSISYLPFYQLVRSLFKPSYDLEKDAESKKLELEFRMGLGWAEKMQEGLGRKGDLTLEAQSIIRRSNPFNLLTFTQGVMSIALSG